MLFSIVAVLCMFTGSKAQNLTISTVKQAFLESRIMPDVLSSFNPTALLHVVFQDPTTNDSLVVTTGQNLNVDQVQNQPQFYLTFNDTALEMEMFVLVMVDPDVPTPSNTSLSQVLHILGGDFHWNSTSKTMSILANSSAPLSSWISPASLAGTPPHRYTIFLYRQPANFSTVAPKLVNASTSILDFNLSVFMHEVGLGSPIAGNYFLASNTSSSSTTLQTGGASAFHALPIVMHVAIFVVAATALLM